MKVTFCSDKIFLKIKITILLLSLFVANSAFSVTGKIIDNYGKKVVNAKIRFTVVDDPKYYYEAYSDSNGNYLIELPGLIVENDKQHILYDAFPNPFVTGTIIPFHLNIAGRVNITIYNSIGQKIRTLADKTFSAGFHQLLWDGTTDMNQRVAPGIFIVYMYFEGRSSATKIMMRANNGEQLYPNGMPNYSGKFITKSIAFNVTITGNNILDYTKTNFIITNPYQTDFIVYRRIPVPYKVSGKYLSVYKDDNLYDTIFINGINLGVGMPGTFPGEMAATSEEYRRWFHLMKDVGFNAIRTYTLHFPRFYDELLKFNEENPTNPLYLLQGVWLDEDLPHGNFFSFSSAFDADIQEVIDCMHGNKSIPERPGRAYGNYTTNISHWILGYIIGREIHPPEVFLTNESNSTFNNYNGTVFGIANGDPIECWFTQRLDKMVLYERQKYKVERPVSISSWPTLDPLYHPTEHDGHSTEDTAQIHMGKIKLKNSPAGFFMSYHAYPYYPDFIFEDQGYNSGAFYDDWGINSYIGYITELNNAYGKYPLLIAEYGVPSSWGNAHTNFTGMNHGGHDFQSQAFSNIRLLNNIHSTGCAGGCLFAWIDEWFKNTWITEPMSCPPDRRPMWHNLCSPEENFGLLSFEPDTINYDEFFEFEGLGRIKKVQAAKDFQFFHLRIYLDSMIQGDDSLWIAYDTYKENEGEMLLPNGEVMNYLPEFALVITKDSANLFVTRSYNTFGKWFHSEGNDQIFKTRLSIGEPWDLVMWQNNFFEKNLPCIQYIGRLRSRDSIAPASHLDAVVKYKNYIDVRIPWQLLNFTDPSQNKVLNDDKDTPEIEYYTTNGIAVTVIIGDDRLEAGRFEWDIWGYVDQINGDFVFPKYKEVIKDSYYLFKQGLKTLNLKPLN